MKKKTINSILAVTLAASMLIMTGCGSSGSSSSSASGSAEASSSSAAEASSSSAAEASSSSTAEADTQAWTIGYSNRDDTDNFLKSVKDEFEKLCKEDDTLNCITADAEGDAQKQLNQLDNFSTQGIDCAIIVPQDTAVTGDYIDQANADGVEVFCASVASESGDFTFVGGSDYELGLKEAEWAHDHLPENAKICYLGGNLGYQISIDRRQALVDGLAERLKTDWDGKVLNEDGDIEVLSWQYLMPVQEEGMQTTEDWLQSFDDIDAIIGFSDSVVLGAMEAVQGAGRDDIMLIGLDGLPDAIQAVKDGTMAATVLQSSETMAKALYDAVKVAQEGGENPENIYIDVDVIDDTNVDDYL